MWKIWLSPGRRISIIVKITEEVATIRFKLIKTAMSPEALVLTTAELLLLPLKDILETSENKNWTIYNGRSRVTSTYNHEKDTVTICKTQFRKTVDIGEDGWCTEGDLTLTKAEFSELCTKIPQIVENLSNKLLKPMVLK